jgi:histidine triad (HIT) family protein
MSTDCLFCKIVAGDIPSTKVYETDTVLVFHDINPAAPTHVLVIPKRHVPNISELADADRGLVADLIMAVSAVAAQEGVQDRFRLVSNDGPASGQSVRHLHFHVLAGRALTWPPG